MVVTPRPTETTEFVYEYYLIVSRTTAVRVLLESSWQNTTTHVRCVSVIRSISVRIIVSGIALGGKGGGSGTLPYFCSDKTARYVCTI